VTGLIDRRELLRVRDFDDARRVQNVLVNTVARICMTTDRRELDDHTSLAMECLSLVREFFKEEATRRTRIACPAFGLDLEPTSEQ
jgi:hypothetical protein